ncbi:MAG: minor capsid protein [Clostridia bacterium]
MAKDGFIHSTCVLKLDPQKIVHRTEAELDTALWRTGELALKTCNFYCKDDQHTLRESVRLELKGCTIRISWNTPYAIYAYYAGIPSKDENTNARIRWAAYAKRMHGKDWLYEFKKSMEVRG